jgi:hypothetical protein
MSAASSTAMRADPSDDDKVCSGCSLENTIWPTDTLLQGDAT